MKTSKCKRCDREVIWAVNKETGNDIQLDASAHTYLSVFEQPDGTPEVRRARTYVAHFMVCLHTEDQHKPPAVPPQIGLFEDDRCK